MSIYSDPDNSRIMAFVDYRSIYNSTRYLEGNVKMDFMTLIKTIVGKRDLKAAYVFDSVNSIVDDNKTVAIHNNLSDQGFRVIISDVVVHSKEHPEQNDVYVCMTC